MMIAVIGGGAGGLAAATRAKRTNPDAKVVVIEKTNEFSRGTCSLPYYLSGEIRDRARLQGVTFSELADKGVELLLETAAIKIEPHQRKLETTGDTLYYDKLIVSTGSRARQADFSIPLDDPRVWNLRSLKSVEKIRSQLATNNYRRVAVVGGGYVGIEFAEALKHRGLQVCLIHRGSRLLGLHPHINQAALQLLDRFGIEVRLQNEVTQIEGSPSGLEVVCAGGTDQFDGVGLAMGIEPETKLLKDAGARLGPSGAVLVTSRGETSLSNIYACGDGVELPNPEGGPGRWVPLATAAARLGRVCGENASGRGGRRIGSHFGSLAIRLFNTQLGIVGSPRICRELEEVCFEWGQPDPLFPTRSSGLGVLFYEPRTQKVRGLQALGPNAHEMVNLVSLAREQGMTVSELQEQDYCYNPPLSGLWHPLYLASREAEKKDTFGFGGRG